MLVLHLLLHRGKLHVGRYQTGLMQELFLLLVQSLLLEVGYEHACLFPLEV